MESLQMSTVMDNCSLYRYNESLITQDSEVTPLEVNNVSVAFFRWYGQSFVMEPDLFVRFLKKSNFLKKPMMNY